MRLVITSNAVRIMASATLVLGLVGCGGPSVPKAELTEHLKKLLPKGLVLNDVTYDSSSMAKQTGASASDFSVKAKIAVTADEDLYTAAGPDDVKAVNEYIGIYNNYHLWLQALGNTSAAAEIAQSMPKIDPAIPKFLHRANVTGDTFSAYCNLVAEHQVDRWIFSPIDGFDWGAKVPGAAASKFGDNSVGSNAPNGEAALKKLDANRDAMQQFRKQVHEKYAKENEAVAAALKPIITGSKIMVYHRFQDRDVPQAEFTFSAFDSQTGSFKWGEVGMGFIDAGHVVLISTMKTVQGDKQQLFAVGTYDPKANELVLKPLDIPNSDPLVIKLGAKTAGGR